MAGAPLLSAVAVLVLTVGIGTNAVVLSVLDGILFHGPPGVGDIGDVVEVSSVSASGRMGTTALSYPEFLAYRDLEATFEEVAVYRPTRVALRTEGQPEIVRAELASSGYFAVLDVQMELGTGFVPGDDRRTGGAAHAVLGHAWWQERMGGSADVLGRRVEVNGRPYTVVGVAPARFYGAGSGDDPVAFWLPASDHPLLFPEEEPLLTVTRRAFGSIARLEDGVTVGRAAAAAQTAWQDVRQGTMAPDADDRRRIDVTPYRGVGSRRVSEAFALLGVVGGLIGGLILLVACANVSGLLLSRALGRRREIGVRLALGARRRRLVRQLLTESLLLATLAGAAGVLLTLLGLDVLERALFTFPVDLAPGFATLALTLGVTGVTGIAFGLTPALHATRASVFTALKDDAAGAGRRSSRLRDGFTVAQLALSLPLLTAGGLLVGQLLTRAAGHHLADPDTILNLRIDLAQGGYTADEVDPLLSRIRERVAVLPGVSDAAFTSATPVTGGGSRFAFLPGSTSEVGGAGRARLVRVAVVDPQYFTTMGIPLLRGRAIQASDVSGTPLVTVVDEAVAQQAWPGEDPLGRTLTLGRGENAVPITVVGVAGSPFEHAGSSYQNMLVYAARRQLPDTNSMTLVVRAAGEAAALAPVVRADLGAVDSDLPVNASVLSEALRASNTELAHASAGAAACGLIALLMACVGLYAMIAAGVTERTREIGVRVALGADRDHLIRHFVRRGLVVTLIAMGVGLPLSWATVSVVGAGMVGVGALAPEVALGLGAVAILMTAVGLLSSWVPARRSSSVDPVLALRAE